jgi:SAM-dependent methyltransferase
MTAGWIEDARTSYDTVAVSYLEFVRDLLDDAPYERAAFALFADQVRAAGGGPVADVGCGPGRITGLLRGLGLDVFGIDLSPAMIELARRDFPGVRFDVGSMTDLDLPDASVDGVIAWYSLIHIPDDEIGTVLRHFHRVLRPGGRLMVGFHVGDGSNFKTEGYGGHPMRIYVHKRQPDKVAGWLDEAGFVVEAHMITTSPESRLGGTMFARRSP